MSSESASFVVVNDSSDDDDVVVVHTKPAGMDSASWKLIQKIHEDNDHKRIGSEVSDLELAKKLQRREDEASASDLLQNYTRQERQRRINQEERALQDAAVALKLAEEENEQNRKALACRGRLSKDYVMESLQPFQRQAVEFVESKAEWMHNTAFPRVERRVISFGFSSEDFTQCMEYIREDAQIVIHLTEATLSQLVKDTHYRNLFETNSSGGSRNKDSRKEWERYMFGDSYDAEACTPFDRPKYGCLNISGDLAGVKSARRYGALFLILHQHMRHRSTFYNKDTGAFMRTDALATNEYYAHILNGYNDADLKAALTTCKSARLGGARSTCTTYKDVQIHGPVCLATDIQALSVPGRERTASEELKSNVIAFRDKAKCNIFWQEDLLYPENE